LIATGDISQRMLTVTLRSLEADGLVVRTIYPEVPPRVEYCLSKSGHTLLPHLDSLVSWAVDNMQDIVNSRQKYGG
jgi:DNA-binding HxlR family transcriptional regulator